MSKEKRELKNLQDYLDPKKNEDLGGYLKATDHRMPVTRREFLNAGLLQFSGWVMAPSIINVLSNNVAHAAECADGAAAAGSGFVPVVTVNASGGLGYPGQFLPMDAGRQPLANYNTLRSGIDGGSNFRTGFKNNARFARTNIGTMLDTFQNILGADLMSKTNVVSMCLRGRDDSSANQATVDGLLERAGHVGLKFPMLAPRGDNVSGLKHQAAFITTTAPVVVSRIEDLLGAVGLPAPLSRLTIDQQLSLVRTIEKTSKAQSRAVASKSGGQNLMDLVECATGQNVKLLEAGTGTVDPSNDANFTSIWNNFAGRRDQQFGSMVYNALNGNAMSCGLEIGGCDYHNRDAATNTIPKDNEIARTIAQTIQSAAALNKPVMVYAITDGGVSATASDNPGQNWRNDNGARSMAIMFIFDPTGSNTVNDFQIGQFTAGQVSDGNHPVSSPQRAAASFFINWAIASGKPEVIDKVLPGVLTPAERDALTVVTNKVG